MLDAATTCDIDVTAADIKIVNCRFGFGHADVVEGFDLSAAGFDQKGGFQEEQSWLYPGKMTHIETWIRWINRETNLYQQVHVKWLEDLEEK